MHDDDREVAEALRLLGEARGKVELAAGLLVGAGMWVAGQEAYRLTGYLEGLSAHVKAVEARPRPGATVAPAAGG